MARAGDFQIAAHAQTIVSYAGGAIISTMTSILLYYQNYDTRELFICQKRGLGREFKVVNSVKENKTMTPVLSANTASCVINASDLGTLISDSYSSMTVP